MPLTVIRPNVQAGFTDAHGFHPLRSSVDYDEDRAGDEYGARTDATGPKFLSRVRKGRRVKVRAPKRKTRARARNGRSYVRRGESVPMHYQPRAGEVWYVDGRKAVIKRVGTSDGTPYVWFARPVDGTLAMSIRNLIQAGRLETGTAGNPSRGSVRKRVGRALTRYVKSHPWGYARRGNPAGNIPEWPVASTVYRKINKFLDWFARQQTYKRSRGGYSITQEHREIIDEV